MATTFQRWGMPPAGAGVGEAGLAAATSLREVEGTSGIVIALPLPLLDDDDNGGTPLLLGVEEICDGDVELLDLELASDPSVSPC